MNAASCGVSQSDMSLQDREEQLRLAVEAAEVGLWDLDVVTGTLYWPPRVKAMFGISADAPATLDDFVAGLHPEDRPAVLEAFAQAQDPASRAMYDVEYRTVGKEDARVRWVAAKGRGLFDEAGVCRRAIGTAIDITRRKEAEALQNAAQQRLHVLDGIERATRALTNPAEVMQVTARLLGEHLDATRCAYADVEADNNRFTIRSDWSRPGVPSSAGAYTLDLFGPQATSNLRAGRHLVVHDVDAELGEDGGGRMFNAIGIKAIVCAGLVKAGRLVAMMAVHQAHPRRWTDDDLRIITDVVDRCWAHIERVRDAAALREQDRRKDEFLATLAHELRNPIAPMLFSLALLQRPQTGEDQARARGVIERQARHLARLIDDLLDVSRINRGLVELQRELVALGPLLSQALETVAPAMERAGHQLSVQVEDAPAWIDADPARVVQIVSNLLTNAAKYTPDRGRIRLSARTAGQVVRIELADNGLGIAPADHGRVFEMFTQLPHTGTKAHGGLGIGLSLVKRLVDMHGGAVGVDSAGLHQGSTFWVELPLAARPPEGAVAQAAAVGDADQAKGRILVVEDNVDGLAALVELIAADGHEVRGAPDGAQALRTAAQWTPDIVLLDLGLPGMDGYAVAARLRQDLGLARARIVALTGWGTQRDREKTAAAGFDAHLTKPVAPDALLALLGRWRAELAPTGHPPRQGDAQ